MVIFHKKYIISIIVDFANENVHKLYYLGDVIINIEIYRDIPIFYTKPDSDLQQFLVCLLGWASAIIKLKIPGLMMENGENVLLVKWFLKLLKFNI